MKLKATDETYIPGHLWVRLVVLGIFLFVIACLFAGSISYVALRTIQRYASDLQIANVVSLLLAGLLIGAFQALTSQSLVGKPTHMSARRTTVWLVGTTLLTVLGIAVSIGPFVNRANSPIFTWAFNNFGFVILMLPASALVGLFQGSLLHNGVRGLLVWTGLVIGSWLLAAKLCEWIFVYLIVF